MLIVLVTIVCLVHVGNSVFGADLSSGTQKYTADILALVIADSDHRQ